MIFIGSLWYIAVKICCSGSFDVWLLMYDICRSAVICSCFIPESGEG